MNVRKFIETVSRTLSVVRDHVYRQTDTQTDRYNALSSTPDTGGIISWRLEPSINNYGRRYYNIDQCSGQFGGCGVFNESYQSTSSLHRQ